MDCSSTSTACCPCRGSRSTAPSIRCSGSAIAGLPFRLITNTTTHTRDALADTLRDAGFTVDAGRHHHRRRRDRRVPPRRARRSTGVPAVGRRCARRPRRGHARRARRSGGRGRDRRRIRRLHLRHDQPHLPVADGRRRVGRHAPQHVLAHVRRPGAGRRCVHRRSRGGHRRPSDDLRQAGARLLPGGARAARCAGDSRRDGRRRRGERRAGGAGDRHDRASSCAPGSSGTWTCSATTARRIT